MKARTSIAASCVAAGIALAASALLRDAERPVLATVETERTARASSSDELATPIAPLETSASVAVLRRPDERLAVDAGADETRIVVDVRTPSGHPLRRGWVRCTWSEGPTREDNYRGDARLAYAEGDPVTFVLPVAARTAWLEAGAPDHGPVQHALGDLRFDADGTRRAEGSMRYEVELGLRPAQEGLAPWQLVVDGAARTPRGARVRAELEHGGVTSVVHGIVHPHDGSFRIAVPDAEGDGAEARWLGLLVTSDETLDRWIGARELAQDAQRMIELDSGAALNLTLLDTRGRPIGPTRLELSYRSTEERPFGVVLAQRTRWLETGASPLRIEGLPWDEPITLRAQLDGAADESHELVLDSSAGREFQRTIELVGRRSVTVWGWIDEPTAGPETTVVFRPASRPGARPYVAHVDPEDPLRWRATCTSGERWTFWRESRGRAVSGALSIDFGGADEVGPLELPAGGADLARVVVQWSGATDKASLRWRLASATDRRALEHALARYDRAPAQGTLDLEAEPGDVLIGVLECVSVWKVTVRRTVQPDGTVEPIDFGAALESRIDVLVDGARAPGEGWLELVGLAEAEGRRIRCRVINGTTPVAIALERGSYLYAFDHPNVGGLVAGVAALGTGALIESLEFRGRDVPLDERRRLAGERVVLAELDGFELPADWRTYPVRTETESSLHAFTMPSARYELAQRSD